MTELGQDKAPGRLRRFWRARPHGRVGRGLRRLWPSGIASRVALILMICLFVVQALSVLVYVRDRAQATVKVFAFSAADRIVAITELMETTPAGERAELLRAVNSPTLWVRFAEAPPRPDGVDWRHAEEVRQEVAKYLGALGDRKVEVQAWGRWRQPPPIFAQGDTPQVPDLLPSRQKIAISVAQADGSWLVFLVSADITSLRWAVGTGAWIVLTGTFILIFAIWAARRVTKPLTRFAEAADRLGVDVRAPALPEAGSRELRRATRAFNRMQERLRRFVDDRTLMLAAISHDLRTMLTRLRLRSEFIEDDEQQRKALADLDEMQAMLDSTLSFARDDTVAEPRTPMDLSALLQSLCDDLADGGQQRGKIRRPRRRQLDRSRRGGGGDRRRPGPGDSGGTAREGLHPVLPDRNLAQPGDRRHRPGPVGGPQHPAPPRRRRHPGRPPRRRPFGPSHPAAPGRMTAKGKRSNFVQLSA
jgi:hypothetical protein